MTDYQRQLVTDNHNLIYRFLQKEKLIWKIGMISTIGMCKAAKTFNEGTSNFLHMHSNVCLMKCIAKKRKRVTSEDNSKK